MPVAVVYADFKAAQSPEPGEILDLASSLGCAAVLVDTWNKAAGPLTNHWSHEQLCNFVLQIQARKMLAVIAGSLTIETVPEILAASPNIIAVRGAACSHSRVGSIDPLKIRALKLAIANHA